MDYILTDEIASNKNNNNIYQPPTYNLLDFPYLIQHMILDHLDVSSLKALRAVCKTTKSLVEEPRRIHKLKVLIMDGYRLEDIEMSEVKWTNMIMKRNLFSTEDLYALLKSLQDSSPFLKHLTIEEPISPLDLIEVVKKVGPGLRSLIIDEDIKMYGHNFIFYIVEEISSVFDEHAPMLKQSLAGLRHLEIRNIYNGITDMINYLVSKLLTFCPDLVVLNIPMIFNIEQDENDDIKDSRCTPLLSYLANAHNLAKIDFGYPNLHNLFYTQDIASPFALTQSTLVQMLKICNYRGLKVKFHNIPSSALPGFRWSTGKIKECLDRQLGSILCANSETGIQDDIYVPPGCPISVLMNMTNKDVSNFVNFKLPTSLNISTLILNFNGKRFSSEQTLFQTLLGVVRPSVSRLAIVMPYYDQESKSQPLILSTIFPKLQELNLADFTATSQDLPLLVDLQELRLLTLSNCDIKERYPHSFATDSFLNLRKVERVKLQFCTIDCMGRRSNVDNVYVRALDKPFKIVG